MSQYLTLLTTHQPRPIKTDEELAATMRVIDSMIERSDLTQDEQDYLELLAIVVQDYEAREAGMNELVAQAQEWGMGYE